jgi:eukaryotic-like serine/threonine-protein kinase
MMGGSTVSPDDDPLGPVVESFLTRFRRGERPALTDLIARHPELAGRIRELIPALVELEQLGHSAGDSNPSPGRETGSRPSWDEGPMPERLGDYRILARIGGGGMGVVYEAERESLKSRVALKVVHPRFRADSKYLRRFHAEARLAAGLHHTNIVGVFDYGEQDGVYFYAMQFIQGQPLDHVLADIRRLREDGTYVDGLLDLEVIFTIPGAGASPGPSAAVRGLLTGRFAATTAIGEAEEATESIGMCDPASSDCPGAVAGAAEPSALGPSSLGGSGELRYFREVARVGAQVADALEYAHRRNVLHRDIKPSNLLLDGMGNVWVTDFGLAKLEEGEDLSQTHELVGTLRYMAPERFRRTSERRGDVYSLGATLYELLVLRPPFEESDEIRLIERIRNEPPAPPRHLDRTIPRDLETIVLKALAKDPADRFGTAGELAAELRRFVEGRPIRSRPVSVVERFWRWCKRDPWLAGASIAAALLTMALALGGTWTAFVYRGQVRQIEEHRDQIRRDLEDLRRADSATQKKMFDSLIARARATRYSRQRGQRFDALAALDEAAQIARVLGLPREELDPLRDEMIACLALPDLQPIGPAVTLPPGAIAATFDRAMTRRALRYRDETISVRRVVDDREIARFRAAGDRDCFILEFSPDGRYLAADDVPSRALNVWDVDRQELVVRDPRTIWWQAPFRSDSRRIMVAASKLHEYDLPTGRLVRIWPGRVDRTIFRPDGARIALIDNGAKPPTCRIHVADSGRFVNEFPLRSPSDFLAWSPDGRTLASANGADRIDFWDTATGNLLTTTAEFDGGGVRMAFHPAGTLLVTGGFDGRIRLWDPIHGRPWMSLDGDGGLRFLRDGGIEVGMVARLTTYQVEPGLEYRTLAHASPEPMNYARVSVRREGRILAVGSSHGVVLWDLARAAELAVLPIGVAPNSMFEASGDLITDGEMGVQRWPVRLDVARGEFRIGPPRALDLPGVRGSLAEDSSGRFVAVAAGRNGYVTTPGGTVRVSPLDDCNSVAVSPDGQWLATGSHARSRGAQVWRIRDGKKVKDLPIDHGTSVDFSPDGKWLVAGSPRLRRWEVGTWREDPAIADIGRSFSSDGRVTVVIDPSNLIRLVEVETGRTLARLESPDLSGVSNVGFSPDGSRLVVSSRSRPTQCVHVWDLRAIHNYLARRGLDWDAPAYAQADPANLSAPPLPEVRIDHGPLGSLAARRAIDEAEGLADRGRWEEAAVAYARALADGTPRHPAPWFAHAVLRLAIGDAAGWSSAGRHMLEVLRETGDREWLEFAAHTLALAPRGPAEPARVVQLAEGRAGVVRHPWSEHVLGLALYRGGRLAEADARLRGSLAGAPGWDPRVLDWLVLAMVDHRLGRHEEARNWLAMADRWVEARLAGRPGGVEQGVPEGWLWRDGILLHLLHREARALIVADPPMLPEDVFAPAP